MFSNHIVCTSVLEDSSDEGYLEDAEKSAENSILDFTTARKELKENAVSCHTDFPLETFKTQGA